jgi:hypothetical protein
VSDRPNPIRTLTSVGVTLNPSDCLPGEQHEMISIKLSEGHPIGYIERCHRCGWIDEKSLEWWVEDAIKQNMSKRAQRIAVAAESNPFTFVQHTNEDLTLEEILFQALAAASMCWEHVDQAGTFNSTRAKEVGMAMMREVNRALAIASRADEGQVG